jgi:hypothetical protein
MAKNKEDFRKLIDSVRENMGDAEWAGTFK